MTRLACNDTIGTHVYVYGSVKTTANAAYMHVR